ncbi:protein-cysteine N-palmitoyltransferase HHAT isoform X2 [Pseudomyrmex gracilis]|uniref:protein-cysteine N-palmitoyltransferase HHAT isoform X2 n=1 Tax=Pseudomyrmex gracilis TaxID=219809 RepID=UPI000994DCB2|nr:protein-cysteine N-palmitoyltransferase HHAT isoform X2 [Pseudomyrmex gracilis]
MKKLLVCFDKYESYLYIFVWSYAVIYSVYEFSLTRNYFDDYYDEYGDFDSGWTWIGRKRDISDLEWRVWLALVWRLIPCVLVHNFVSQYIKVNSSKTTVLCCWYILSSLAFTCYHLGVWSMLYLILHPTCLHILTCVCGKNLIWFTHVLYLFVIHVLKIPDGAFQTWLELSDEQHCTLTIAMCWTHLRSISHNIDSNEKYHLHSSYGFIQKLAYCLYLPTLFLGPLTLYHEFVDSIDRSHHYWTWKELRTFAINLSRCIFWLYLTELLLHFVYVNAIQYHPQVVQNLNPWALYGLGYSMGQFFLNKYVVIYGTCGTLSNLDNIKVPPKPKCIARIHLYSDMWKHFDRGLYTFLVKYIYIPIQKANVYCGRLIASFLCFTFVFLWHGLELNIFTWTLFNFIGLTIESIGKTIGSWKVLLSLLCFLYCCCQVSTDVKSWELHCLRKA